MKYPCLAWKNPAMNKIVTPTKTFFDFERGSTIRCMKDMESCEAKKGEEYRILSNISVYYARRRGYIRTAQICVNGVIETVELSYFRLVCPETC